MMNATIFPYTYITDDEIQVLNLLFGQPKLYLASDVEMPPSIKDAYRKGQVSLCLPLEDQTDRRMLRSVLAECRSWAGSLDLRAAAVQSSQEPLTEEAFSANIRASIKKQAASSPKGKESSPLLADQVFLQMAQILDSQHFDMELSLRKFQEKEKKLMEELAEPGEETTRKIGVSLSNADTPRVRSLGRRLKSWSLLLNEDPAPTGLFVTFTSDAIDLLLDKTDPQPLSFSITGFPWPPVPGEGISQWQEAFLACVEDFVSGDINALQTIQGLEGLPVLESEGAESNVIMRIAVIEDEPRKWISRTLGKEYKAGETSDVRNTVLVCLEKKAA